MAGPVGFGGRGENQTSFSLQGGPQHLLLDIICKMLLSAQTKGWVKNAIIRAFIRDPFTY